ncbi:ComEA family DNA-binding protein [Pseudoxanthomonas kaohsiungensis]|uniref:ComEA family DNA-binding protein n=1 Tax=Pseudoxanthomonas kaohsiungensis TaxID=283923 RepID=A0ABW3LUY4_9GAMM|nr:ComEA family DNA-binding protein [Pseudoxanthomonas kaohsiungensis]KAF1702199.1 competence protein ComEA [Pseudoxanthomonas kaohsiungensis]
MNPFFLVLKSLLLSMLLLAGSAFAADKVDINRADAAQLEASLVGIGPAKAQAIVEHRNANGPFKSADELALVKGIGLKTVERNRDLIAVGAPAKAARPSAAPAKPVAGGTPKPVARR